MKNLAILFILTIFINPSYSQRWNSAFVGKPESRALYASNVAKAIQNAWESELISKGKKEMLLDEIIFGQDSDPKEFIDKELVKSPISTNIDEIEEALGIKEEIKNDPVKKKGEISNVLIPEKTKPIVESEIKIYAGKKDEVLETTANDKPKFNKGNNQSTLVINNDDIKVDSVYLIPQVSPMFPGGRNAMKSFFANNITTPESKGESVRGKVFIRFMVKKNGELSKIYLVKGLNDACNKEAIRIVKKMPAWIPAMHEGEAVSSWHTLPVYFDID